MELKRRFHYRSYTLYSQIPRRRFSHFGYPSESESDQEVIEQPNPESTQPVAFPELDDLEPLFSDKEETLPKEPIRNLLPSPTGTSAPLLSHPSLTDILSNFPLFISQAGNSINPAPHVENEPQEKINAEYQIPDTRYQSGATSDTRQNSTQER